MNAERRNKAERPSLLCVLRSSLCAYFFAGCSVPPPNLATSQPTTVPAMVTRITSLTGHRIDNGDPRDPQPAVAAMVHLDVYTLQLPIGAGSDSKEFWQSIDEQAVGVAMEDRLYNSGIRTGIAPKSQGAFFSQFFDRHVVRKLTSTANGLHADTIELDLGKKTATEDVFFYDSSGRSTGRTYDQCTNDMMLGFGPTPRDPSGVRLTFCPVIKCETQRVQYTSLNQEYEPPASDEIVHLYDIGFSVDVPDDSFFILAPSPGAMRPNSLGGRFLVMPDKTERLEQVIVVVPTFLRMDGKAVNMQSVVISEAKR